MNDRNIDQLLGAWIDLGPAVAPDRVADAARLEARTTRQTAIPALRPPRGFPQVDSYVKLALAAAAVVVAAALGFNYLNASNDRGPGVRESTPMPVPSPTPVGRLSGQDPLDPGRYVAGSESAFDVSVEVPAGWSAGGRWVAIGPRDNKAPDGMAIRFYTVDNLAANPLLYVDGVIDPPLGPTVEDLVQAIADHPAWESTAPTDIVLDGYAGQLVTLTIPADAQIGEPPGDRYYLSLDPGSGGIWGWSPGQTFDWYIVDVDGERYIIDAFHYPGTSEEDLAAQRAVVESVRFHPKP